MNEPLFEVSLFEFFLLSLKSRFFFVGFFLTMENFILIFFILKDIDVKIQYTNLTPRKSKRFCMWKAALQPSVSFFLPNNTLLGVTVSHYGAVGPPPSHVCSFWRHAVTCHTPCSEGELQNEGFLYSTPVSERRLIEEPEMRSTRVVVQQQVPGVSDIESQGSVQTVCSTFFSISIKDK